MYFFSYITIFFFSSILSLTQIKKEEITIENGSIQLPGTLTYTEDNSPLIIWVHGSGNIDRNGNQKPMVNANYIEQFRVEINKKGIAFFSYDKRTSNSANMKIIQKEGIVFNDFVNDVKKVIQHFKKDNRFSEIILIGHSQGSLIAMLAAENVNKYISLAGAGETIDKTLIRQVSKQSVAYGKIIETHIKELKETGEIKKVNPNLLSLFAKPNQPFMASWMKVNPIEEIKKLSIPVLIINGDKDIQVRVEDANNLHDAKPDATFIIVKNMNHVLKDIEKDEDNIKSYMTPDFKISEELVEVISKFIKTKV
ncbi:MAG: alpha/beta hydrolase [Flavobacteriaceae bacterium]|nr:alpha/beta hydrolase [Flavobacteriaceae bacterium]